MKYLNSFRIFESVEAPLEIRIRFTKGGMNKFYELLSPLSPSDYQSYWEELKDDDGLNLPHGTLRELFYVETSNHSQDKPEFREFFIHYDRHKQEVYLNASEPNYLQTFSSKPNFSHSGNPGHIYFKFDKLDVGGISDRGKIFEIVEVKKRNNVYY